MRLSKNMTQDRVIAADLKAMGWNRCKALLPALRVPSVALPPSGSEEANRMWHFWQEVWEAPGDAFRQMDGVLRNVAPPSVNEQSDYPAFVFQSNGGKHSGRNGVFDNAGISVLDARVWTTDVIFVHFFSGHRREQDLQVAIEETIQIGTVKVWCLSVDLCLQGSDGDLMDRNVQQKWIEALKSRRIIGGGGGSPCETFSAARFQDGGPPPLRSADEVFGLPNLRPKYAKQVLIGNALLQFITEFLMWTSVLGGCGFAEHPQFPVWLRRGDVPSIWTTQVIRWLKSLKCVAAISFDQCIVGGVSPKPTTLLLVRMHGTRDFLLTRGNHGRCNHGPCAHAPLIGKKDGQFQTGKAKIYPSGLNEALSFGIHDYVQNVLNPEGAIASLSLPKWAERFHPKYDKAYFGVVQRDYYG